MPACNWSFHSCLSTETSMVTKETFETCFFYRKLVDAFGDLWAQAAREHMVCVIPQTASLESEIITKRQIGEYL